MPTNVFISYSHADEKSLDRLHKHLAMLRRDGTLNAWTDHAIMPGDKLNNKILTSLNTSAIFIALVSPDYLASNYCYDKEFQHALKLADSGALRIVPIILEPCDWLASPLKDFMALPKDGQPISGWANQNNAYLDVVVRLRLLLNALLTGEAVPSEKRYNPVASSGRLRIKQDFDSIQKAEFADKTYMTIKDYFKVSCTELNEVGDSLRAKFEDMDPTAFTCTVVNRAKRNGGEADITVRNSKGRKSFGDINYVHQRYFKEENTSNGSVSVEADDYSLYLKLDAFSYGGGRETKLTPERAAEILWNNFVKQAGVEYE